MSSLTILHLRVVSAVRLNIASTLPLASQNKSDIAAERSQVKRLIPAFLARWQVENEHFYRLDIAASDHQYYKHCYLRLMPADGSAPPKVVGYVYGGQGTINVASWSPDGAQVAFVSNSDLLQLRGRQLL